MKANFDSEHESLQKFLVEQKYEKSANKKKKDFMSMKKKIDIK